MVRFARLLAISALALLTPLQAAAAPCAGFTDVDDSDPFCTHVGWIKNRNITAGCTATLYCPHEAATRLQMAAFLNRLGDVLLPPNVIGVAPVGGQFQSIQAAIDYAASNATAQHLIKVAPGTYNEPITTVPGVDVEGSGPELTRITGAVCSPSAPPTAGTVTIVGGSQLRGFSVAIAGTTTNPHCAAIHISGHRSHAALRDVQVYSHVLLPTLYGIRVVAPDFAPQSAVDVILFQNVSVDLSHSTGPATGVWVTGTPTSRIDLSSVRVHAASSSFPSATAIRLTDFHGSLDRVQASAANPNPMNFVVLRVEGASSDVSVHGSTLRGGIGIFAANPDGTLRIANSLLEGTLSGTATCFNNYTPAFGPVAC